MSTFGKKMRECREAKGFSQNALSGELGVHHSIIGKYERDEVKPTIDVVKRMAGILDTTVGYLLGETENNEVLKDPTMLKRLAEINSLSEKDREHFLYTIDAMLRDVKARQAYAS